MGKITVIQQGEQLPFVFDRDGFSIEGWICTINVKQFPSDASLITRTITPTNNLGWSGFLTSMETMKPEVTGIPPGLETGLYRLIGKLTNATTDQAEFPEVRFNVTTAWPD